MVDNQIDPGAKGDAPVLPGRKSGGRRDSLLRMLDSLAGLADAVTASAAACALLADDLADAGVVLAYRSRAGDPDIVLADYPCGIGLGDIAGAESITVAVGARNASDHAIKDVWLAAWRSAGDREFSAEDRAVLEWAAEKFAPLVTRMLADRPETRVSLLDPETGLWCLAPFLEKTDRRFDRLDVEERAGTMFAIGWVRSDGAATAEASPIVIRGSVGCLQEMLRPADLLGRIAPTRIAAWCDGVDHLIGAERADRIVTGLDGILAGSGRHAAIGIATRWPRSGHDPATVLVQARAGLEQARLAAAAKGRAAVRIWQGGTGP